MPPIPVCSVNGERLPGGGQVSVCSRPAATGVVSAQVAHESAGAAAGGLHSPAG